MIKRSTYSFLIALSVVLSLSLFSCKKNNYKNTDFGYTYFGMEQGRFIEYEVQYIEHDSLLNKHDTTSFYYKTVIGDKYIDNEGRKGFEFMRYKKDSLNQNYVFLSKWTIFLEDNKAQLVEENQRKIKLVFPVNKTQIWDINAFNPLGEQNAHYENINTAVSYSNLHFDTTTTVEFKRYKTLIDDQLEQEVYAKNVGMIYKVSKELYFQFGISKPFKGTETYYTVINYGKE